MSSPVVPEPGQSVKAGWYIRKNWGSLLEYWLLSVIPGPLNENICGSGPRSVLLASPQVALVWTWAWGPLIESRSRDGECPACLCVSPAHHSHAPHFLFFNPSPRLALMIKVLLKLHCTPSPCSFYLLGPILHFGLHRTSLTPLPQWQSFKN